MSQVYSFAEESCWRGEDFRHVRKEVVFKVFSIGRSLGDKFSREFQADYGLWWDQEDEILLQHLRELDLPVRWDDLVFHKKIDQSGIDVYNPESDRLVARIEVRRYEGRRLDPANDDFGPNVRKIVDFIAERLNAVESDKGQNPSGET